jgi:hemoglobin
MARPSIYEAVGGDEAFLALATAFHARCLADPVLEHPFSHPGSPEHVERLAEYWAEVFGGPPRYSKEHGGHSAMLEIHARQGADEDLGRRFAAAFMAAADDAGLPADPTLRTPCATTSRGRSRRSCRSPRETLASTPNSPRRGGAGTGWRNAARSRRRPVDMRHRRVSHG